MCSLPVMPIQFKDVEDVKENFQNKLGAYRKGLNSKSDELAKVNNFLKKLEKATVVEDIIVLVDKAISGDTEISKILKQCTIDSVKNVEKEITKEEKLLKTPTHSRATIQYSSVNLQQKAKENVIKAVINQCKETIKDSEEAVQDAMAYFLRRNPPKKQEASYGTKMGSGENEEEMKTMKKK